MKRLIVFVVFAAGIFMAVRRLAGSAAPLARDACDRMEAKVPEWFPPKRMMVDLATVKEQNARILELLEAADRPTE